MKTRSSNDRMTDCFSRFKGLIGLNSAKEEQIDNWGLSDASPFYNLFLLNELPIEKFRIKGLSDASPIYTL